MSGGRLRPLVSDPSGKLRPASRGWEALGQSGWEPQALRTFIPLPEGSTLMHLPDRPALGRRPGGEPELVGGDFAWAVSAVLPVGYLRLLFPAYLGPSGEAPATWVSIFLRKSAARFRAESVARFRRPSAILAFMAASWQRRLPLASWAASN